MYFEAHDIFESIWMDNTEPDSEFYRGLIHTSVGFYHLRNKNHRGAKSQLLKGLDRLSRFDREHKGIMLGDFRADLEHMLIHIERVLQGRISGETEIVFPSLSMQTGHSGD
jgi:predicted metal-dependent hydrolase